jgi:hypothetical protein
MWFILGFYYQGFTEVQMSKLKKSEAFTREREREIEQVSLKKHFVDGSANQSHIFDSTCYWSMFAIVCLLSEGCRVSQRACTDHEGSFSSRDWSGIWNPDPLSMIGVDY